MATSIISRTSPPVRLSAAGMGTGTAARDVTNPGAKDGELLVAIQSQTAGTSGGMLAPSGFQQKGATGGSGTVGWMKVWVRRASNEPAVWSFSGDGNGCVVVLVVPNWDDRDDASTFDVLPTFTTGTATATHNSPSITMARTTNRLIRAFAGETGGVTHATVAGYVEHQDVSAGGSNSLSVQSQESGGAGTTGVVSSTASASSDYVACSIAISSPPHKASVLYQPSVRLPHWSTADNAMVVFIGANSQGGSADTECRVSSVTDDAHNLWYEGSTIFTAPSNTLTRTRGAIWYCVNAKAITSLTVTMTQIVDSLAIEVMEWSELTNVSPVDVAASAQNASTTSLSASGTTTNANDVVFAMAVNGDSSITLAATGSNSWTTTQPQTAGGNVTIGTKTASLLTGLDDVAIVGAYKSLSAAGAQSTGFTNSSAAGMGWCFLALKKGLPDKTNPNPRWPQVVHEIGFGADPNNLNAAITYTEITGRVTKFACQRGRNYELARTEAGEMQVEVNNYDAAFNPLNTSGPYYGDLRVITPYRVRATWDGVSRNLFTGYIERWPQKWDNQRGVGRLQVVDGLATLAATRLVGTLGNEILADQPHAYWPLDDSRLSDQAANKAVTTTTALLIMTSVSGGGTAGFGADLALQSEESTCWEQRRLSTSSGDSPNAIYGKCLAADMDLPQLSDGILVEVWAKIPPLSPVQNYTLIALKASTFTTGGMGGNRRVALLQLDGTAGLPFLVTTDTSGNYYIYNATSSGYNDDAWHHYVAHFTTTTARLWIDGELKVAVNPPTPPTSTIDRVSFGGEIDAWTSSNIAVGQFAHAAIFEIASVDSRRVAARANAGFNGFPERTGARIARVLNYAGWRADRAIDEGLSFLGAAGTLARQTLLAAVQDIASWENGLAHVDANGTFRFIDRASRFNQNVKWIFGDDPAGGEIPFQADAEIELDPKYVFNDVKVTRSISKLPDGTVVTGSSSAQKKDQASIATYFNRSLDKTSGVSSISQCEAEAAWLLENYAQPRPRLSRISITPSANPSLWPIALDLELGDRVLVRRRPFGGSPFELDCYIEQIQHTVAANEWKMLLTLVPVLETTYGGQNGWILDTSALDIDTVVESG